MTEFASASLTIELPAAVLDEIARRVADRLAEQPAESEPWIGVKDAATHLACKPQRIYDLVSRRAIPHRKEGNRLLFRRSELDGWVAAGCPSACVPAGLAVRSQDTIEVPPRRVNGRGRGTRRKP